LLIETLSHELAHYAVEGFGAVIANARVDAIASKDAGKYEKACNLTEGFARSSSGQSIGEMAANKAGSSSEAKAMK
jgi:hypothetical protein